MDSEGAIEAELAPIQILDVIMTKGPWSQVFLLLDRMPVFKYQRVGRALLAQDGPFYDALWYEAPSPRFSAFGGRKFNIPMKDGSVVEASGQWWAGSHPISKEKQIAGSVGISTLEDLHRCYVFSGGAVEQSFIADWFSKNEPSDDYRKYDKNRKPPIQDVTTPGN